MALNSNFRTLTADNIEGIVEDRNYLKSSFENGTITGWTEVAVALTSGLPTGTPTIGATAASSLALSATSVTPLSGSRSLLVDVPSALTAGHGFISDEFTLDRMDLGKVLTVSFDYERVTGTYNFSGTLGSQTWMVYIYDATLGAANWIQPAGFLGMNQSSGPGRVRATFQSSVTAGQKYRVAVIASQAAAGASSIEFDNFSCSRQTAPIGPVVTDWVSYTPTLSAISIGNGTLSAVWRRVGDSIEVDIGLTAGSTTSFGGTILSPFLFSLPTGLSFDANKLAQIEGEGPVGLGTVVDVGAQNYGPYNVSIANSNYVQLRAANASGTWVTSSTPIYNGNPITLGVGDQINVHFSAPISGWASQVQLSNDTDTRVVAFNAYDGAQVAITNTTAVLPLGTTSVDTNAVRSGNTYVIPVSGFYRLSAKSTTKFSVGNTTFTHALIPYKNGVAQFGGDYGNADGVNSANLEFYYQAINSIFRLNAGDIIDFRYFTDYTGVATTYLKYCSIERLSGPSVVAASETVAVIARKNTGSQTTSGSVQTVSGWLTPDVNTHGTSAFNPTTGIFTAPISGTYQFSGNITFGINGTGYRSCYLSKNSPTSVYAFGNFLKADASVRMSVQVNSLVYLNAGETCMLVAYQDAGGSVGYSTLTEDNHISIVRVGN